MSITDARVPGEPTVESPRGLPDGRSGRPAHVYVHVPFCARRCSYCDFKIAVRSRTPVTDYLRGIRKELALRFPSEQPWPVDTLYLGGGTPSRLGSEGICELVAALGEKVDLGVAREITIEANPDDVTLEVVRRWRESGINRVSLGAQSFDDGVLSWMHRTHTAERITEAVSALTTGGIANWSLDLIFAIPSPLARDWTRDLEQALALDPPHISLYGLTVEPHTQLGRWRERGEVAELPEERYEAEFLEADDFLARNGFEHYEVSNYTRPGFRARHNSSYWRGVPYVGLGPAAHGFDGNERRWNDGAYPRWLARLDRGEDPVEGRETLDVGSHAAEAVYLGLRTEGGLTLRPGEPTIVEPWVAAGWATLDGDVLRLTPLGWLRLDSLAVTLTISRSR